MALGKKSGGRQPGTPNRITAAFREAVQTVYNDIGGDAAFARWARENPGEFYRIAARLIPVQVASTSDPPRLNITIMRAIALPAEREIVKSPALSYSSKKN